MSGKRKRSSSPPPSLPSDVYTSAATEDRESRFVGYFSPTLAPKDLQRLADLKSASHKILAWRKAGQQRSLTGNIAQYDLGHDDDGEKFGGKKVEKVLEMMRVTGACVVARWYGGVMLGPVRFTHMEECAKGAVMKWQEWEAEEGRKKQKVVEDDALRVRLAKTLGERDRSVEVLRAMAAEKEGRAKEMLVAGMADLDGNEDGTAKAQPSVQSSQNTALAASPKKPSVDYSSMSVDRLKALDKARDATIAFLLKRISKAETDLAALGEAKVPP